MGWNVYARAGFEHSFFGFSVGAGTSWQRDWNHITDIVDYSNYTNKNESFSTSNMHTGPVCRRYVGNSKSIIVSLFVYRANGDGGIEGEEITVKIDLNKARASADDGGVVYGR